MSFDFHFEAELTGADLTGNPGMLLHINVKFTIIVSFICSEPSRSRSWSSRSIFLFLTGSHPPTCTMDSRVQQASCNRYRDEYILIFPGGKLVWGKMSM